MQTTFLSALATALAGTQHRLNVAIESAHADSLKVVVTADLGPTPEKASDSEVQLRAAMCRPLILVGCAQEIEGALVQRLTHHVQALNEGHSLLDEIRSIGATVLAKAAAEETETPVAPISAPEVDDAEEPDSGDVNVDANGSNLLASF